MPTERVIEFRTDTSPIGSNPDLASTIVWHVVHDAGRKGLDVTEVALKRMSLTITIKVRDGEDPDAYVQAVGEQLRDSVQNAVKELSVGVRSGPRKGLLDGQG
jgi:hypothetical protein